MKGGRPDKPVLVSQFKYDLDSLYREVEDGRRPASRAARTPRGGSAAASTSSSPTRCIATAASQGAKDASSSRMYGTLQVVDVSDIEHPEVGGVVHAGDGRRAQRLGRWRTRSTSAPTTRASTCSTSPASSRAISARRGARSPSLNTADMGGVVQERGVRLGRGGESEGRTGLRERLQQRALGRSGQSEEDQHAADPMSPIAGVDRSRLAGACSRAPCAGRRHAARPRTTSSSSPAKGTIGSRSCGSGPAGATVERERKIGTNPTELVGPHGAGRVARRQVVLRLDGARHAERRALEVLDGGDAQVGRVSSAAFPATVQVAPNGHYAWVVNFNLYGDMVPSSVSVVYTDEMVEMRACPPA